MVAWRALLVLVPLSLACSPVERNFSSSSSSGTASHMGGSTSTSSHQGGAGGMGAGSSTGGNGGSGITEAQACSQYAAKICAKNETCAPDVLTYTYGDVATCVQRYEIFCKLLDKAPQTAWTPKQFADCADALSGQSCPDYLLAPFNGGPPVCYPKHGGIDDNKPCIDAGQCKSAYCKHNGSTACGVCTEPADAGAACDSVFDCKVGLGLACAGPMGGTVCVPAKQAGKMCSGNGDCDFGTACLGGICQKALNEGDGCGPSSLCDPLQGLYCNSATMVCTRAFYSAPGQFCGISDGADGGPAGVYGCTASGFCKNAPNGLCVAPAPDGGMCNLMGGPGCMTPAGCVNGTCTIPDQSNCP